MIEIKDLNDIVNIYNSNKLFLKSHIGKESITVNWVCDELDAMKKEGFYSCKVVQKNSNKIVGLIDFKVDKETYLSLLMINSNLKGQGIGTNIYKLLEMYIKSCNSNSLRIDIVTNYDKDVLNFWIKNGFKRIDNITLNWNEQVLPAVVMKKELF
ncbi:GNAT family N-acetyltransferase [Romboutsia sp.]|uniref:GNAT family N-acetyltransferase n=1 Tax=Romboutsia sp. TaxID=1965302 RepID=UPI002D0E9DE2|nr:GNAT family N-acetyltransferase [Romboutsia sp.]HSQ87202.1 GNAT family N-acetyltransferase [Romboutsia sp.]